MPERRPDIPTELERRVLMEAGHRCAIPTCRSTPVEIAHIIPWSQVREHTFENLIALCPTCHTRYDHHQIDRLSMKGYKANLGLVSGRYNDTERRILEYFATNPDMTDIRMPSTGWGILLMYLIKDGLIVNAVPLDGMPLSVRGVPIAENYRLTEVGKEFIRHWVEASPVSSEIASEPKEQELCGERMLFKSARRSLQGNCERAIRQAHCVIQFSKPSILLPSARKMTKRCLS
jgi:hypothetical protein